MNARNASPAAPLRIYFETRLDKELPFCRYPRDRLRTFVRWLLRRGSLTGQERVFLNLVKGLDELGVSYSVNDATALRAEPAGGALCVIGKPHILARIPRSKPILFGPLVYSHPIDDPGLPGRYDVRRILVPCEWMREMCESTWGPLVHSWPVGIDTEYWHPAPAGEKDVDVLIYDKLRWHWHFDKRPAIEERCRQLRQKGLSVETLAYGFYREEDFHALLRRCRTMVFFCEHETQGLAYQQALSSGVPILAWDEIRTWEDPDYYPDRVRFSPVTSVPYWDRRCGWKRRTFSETLAAIEEFAARAKAGCFTPRDYIVENLSLSTAATEFLRHVTEVEAELEPVDSA